MENVGDHSFSTYAKFSEKLTFLNPRYAHQGQGKLFLIQINEEFPD